MKWEYIPLKFLSGCFNTSLLSLQMGVFHMSLVLL